MDMQVSLVPTQPDGFCALLEAGTLVVNLQAVSPGTDSRGRPWPVEFSFYGYRGFDEPATIDTTISSTVPTTVSAPLQGDNLYCFSLQNLVQVPQNAGNATLTQFTQPVSVRMSIQH
jgi:hypothetical protein